MTIREKLKHKGLVVDCSGPDGNVLSVETGTRLSKAL